MYWILPDGSYYEGPFVPEGSILVPQRPSPLYKWDGTEWVIDNAAVLAANQVQALLDLQASDVVVIRSFEIGIMLPADWAAYRAALRFVLNSTDISQYGNTYPVAPIVYPSYTTGEPNIANIMKIDSAT